MKQLGWHVNQGTLPGSSPPAMPTAGDGGVAPLPVAHALLGLHWSLSTEHQFEFLCPHKICLILNPAHSK